MKIAIACDHGGYLLKQDILIWLEENDIDYEDFGCYSTESVDYPVFAERAARAVAAGECDKGIVICTTGYRRFHRRQQGEGHTLRAVHRLSPGGDDAAAQRRQHDGAGCRHHRRQSGQADGGDLPAHGV